MFQSRISLPAGSHQTVAQRTLQPEREQHARAVRRNLHARAELGEPRRLLVDLDVVAVAQQCERSREAADARADDQDAHALSGVIAHERVRPDDKLQRAAQ